jgi:putative serine protease PepD
MNVFRSAQIESESGGNDGVGFAIPSNTVRTVVARLLRGAT